MHRAHRAPENDRRKLMNLDPEDNNEEYSDGEWADEYMPGR